MENFNFVCKLHMYLLKPGQNKKGQKFFQLHRFLNTFLQLAAEKKYSKNGATENFFGPSYFVTALTSNHFSFLPFALELSSGVHRVLLNPNLSSGPSRFSSDFFL